MTLHKKWVYNKKTIIIISILSIIIIITGIIVYNQSFVYSVIVTEWGTIDKVTPKDSEYFIQSEDREATFYELGEKYGISPTESSRKPQK